MLFIRIIKNRNKLYRVKTVKLKKNTMKFSIEFLRIEFLFYTFHAFIG
jgi:hypothetical protein